MHTISNDMDQTTLIQALDDVCVSGTSFIDSVRDDSKPKRWRCALVLIAVVTAKG